MAPAAAAAERDAASAAAWWRSTTPGASRLCPPRSGSGTVRYSSRARKNPGMASTTKAARQLIRLARLPPMMKPKAVPAISPPRM